MIHVEVKYRSRSESEEVRVSNVNTFLELIHPSPDMTLTRYSVDGEHRLVLSLKMRSQLDGFDPINNAGIVLSDEHTLER